MVHPDVDINHGFPHTEGVESVMMEVGSMTTATAPSGGVLHVVTHRRRFRRTLPKQPGRVK